MLCVLVITALTLYTLDAGFTISALKCSLQRYAASEISRCQMVSDDIIIICCLLQHFPWPWLELPSSPSHTLPVNHPNFIDITGITDETLSAPRPAASVQLLKQTSTCTHVHKYTVPHPPPPTVCTQQPFSCM